MHRSEGGSLIEYAKVEEGVYHNGEWIVGRGLNGHGGFLCCQIMILELFVFTFVK